MNTCREVKPVGKRGSSGSDLCREGACHRPRRRLAGIRPAGAAEGSVSYSTRRIWSSSIKLDPTIKLDIRYAGTNNFLGKPVYKEARAFLQRPAAEAVVRAHRALAPHGYGLLIHDGYRPWAITKLFWDMTSGKQREFVADPKSGSKHNRGAAVDLTMYELKTGKAVQMPGDYDEMTERSYPDYAGGPADARARRDLLRKVMEAEGLRSSRTSGGITITRTGANTPFSTFLSAQSESRFRRSPRMEYVIDLFLHLDVHLAEFVAQYGIWVYAMLFAIIFIETGLVIWPFLPGDSLLFAAGALAATGVLDI